MKKNISEDGWFSEKEVEEMGFQKVGENVLISKKTSLYGCDKISIGSNIRIDDFVTISSSNKINIGSNVHIGAYSYIAGGGVINIGDYCGISQGVRIYSTVDDFFGFGMSNPVIDNEFRNTTTRPVNLHKYSLIGSGVTILPGVSIGFNTAIGAMSLVNRSIGDNLLAFGNPCVTKIKRSQKGYKKYEERKCLK